MKPRRTISVFSWIFMVFGLLNLITAVGSSSYDPTSPAPGIALIAISMAGFGFLAYLDSKRSE